MNPGILKLGSHSGTNWKVWYSAVEGCLDTSELTTPVSRSPPHFPQGGHRVTGVYIWSENNLFDLHSAGCIMLKIFGRQLN